MSSTHTISSGETLSSIARRYHSTVDAIAKANNIQNPNVIVTGRQLAIPDGFEARPRPSSGPQAGDGFQAQSAQAAAAPGSIPSPASGQYDGTHAAPGTTNTQAWIPVNAPLQGSPSNRNAATYADVIDQFAVGSNPRYARRDGNTYCNIFAWDVTKAMGAEIPHWVDGAGNPTGVGQGRELDANGGHLWLQNHGSKHGWREVSAEEAQRMANQGHPTVASWHNPGGIGHIAVVRPGEINGNGPAIAQAGSRNFNDGHVRDSFGNANVKYFVNDRGTATQGPAQPAPSQPSTPSAPAPSQPTQPTAGRFSVPQNDLQRGAQGEEVRQLQSALVNLGYMTQAQMDTGPGTFGPQTEASLKRFQTDSGVPSTGYYGPMTREALTKRAGAPSFSVPQNDLQRGSQGEEVRQLQSALVKLGYMTQAQMDTGPGTFGPQTEASLKRFQADSGVPNTGYYGPMTREALTKRAGGSSPAPTGPGPVTGPSNPAPSTGGVSLQQLRQIMPNLSEARAQQMLPHLNAAMAEAGINTPRRQAAFLAQLAHESGEFRYMEEIASGAAYEGRTDLGNTQPGDGVRFKGRGPIQLTGRSNYQAASRALGIDLVSNPTRAADPDVGFRTAAWFWNSRNLNSYADAGNFDAITYRVNGGYNGKASRDAYYNRALQVLGG